MTPTQMRELAGNLRKGLASPSEEKRSADALEACAELVEACEWQCDKWPEAAALSDRVRAALKKLEAL